VRVAAGHLGEDVGDLVAEHGDAVAEVILSGVALGDRLGGENRVGLHDAGPTGVLGHGVEDVPEERGPLRLRASGNPRGFLAVAVLQHGDQQGLFAAEVVKHSGVGHPGLLGHFDQAALVVATLSEHAHRRPQHRFASIEGPGARVARPGGTGRTVGRRRGIRCHQSPLAGRSPVNLQLCKSIGNGGSLRGSRA
jgi:hypothetical protein